MPGADQSVSSRDRNCFCRTKADTVDLLLHSTDGDESEFRKLCWNTKGWEKQIRPADWDYPSYASADGVGKVFLIVRSIQDLRYGLKLTARIRPSS